jgi:peroxiredoxin
MLSVIQRTLPHLALVVALLAAGAAAAVEAGDPAPEFKAAALTGKGALRLADYRGKVVYLDFWASWCAPCAAALPEIEKLRQEFPAERFQVLAVNVDRDPQKARKFLGRHPIGYPSASDPNGRVPASFGLDTMPTSYLIDRRGVVRYVHRGFRRGDIDAIREHVAELVGKKR